MKPSPTLAEFMQAIAERLRAEFEAQGDAHERVVVTGLGVVCPHAADVDAAVATGALVYALAGEQARLSREFKLDLRVRPAHAARQADHLAGAVTNAGNAVQRARNARPIVFAEHANPRNNVINIFFGYVQ